MNFRSIPLDVIPNRPLTIDVGCGDGDRFVRLFTSAWSELPNAVRKEVITHWTKEENSYVSLELSNAWKNCKSRDAEVSLAGCEMKFNAAEVDRMPEDVVKSLIAHEFAHVYQYAVGISGRKNDELEDNAEELISNWGFNWVASSTVTDYKACTNNGLRQTRSSPLFRIGNRRRFSPGNQPVPNKLTPET